MLLNCSSGWFLKSAKGKLAFILVLSLIGLLTAAAVGQYAGNPWVFLLFTALLNALFINGISRGAFYFDTFIGLFMWLGFWLKAAVRVAFFHSTWHASVGAFDGSGAMYDRALLAASVGALGFLCASLLRRRFVSVNPDSKKSVIFTALYSFYRRHRYLIVGVLIVVVLSTTLSNLYFCFYQRGEIAKTHLPFCLNGVYAWLLQFGLASVSAYVLHFEVQLRRQFTDVAILVPLLESFASNISLLGRGMFLNLSAFGVAGLRIALTRGIPLRRALVVGGVLFASLMWTSVLTVNSIRLQSYYQGGEVDLARKIPGGMKAALSLVVDRWVGIEGVLAVTGSGQQGWALWHDSGQERLDPDKLSIYDNRLINSPYTFLDKQGGQRHNHYVSLPGMVAFAWYPGVWSFLFLIIFFAGILGAAVEIFVSKFGGANPFPVALLIQVLALRYASFGYVPANSYVLLSALFLNVLLVYCLEYLLRRFGFGKKMHRLTVSMKRCRAKRQPPGFLSGSRRRTCVVSLA